jgi:hypothetical protein
MELKMDMQMKGWNLLYKVKAVDEFNRHYEANAKVSGTYLVFKEQADSIYLQLMIRLLTDILLKMGSDAKAEWVVEVDEEFGLED